MAAWWPPRSSNGDLAFLCLSIVAGLWLSLFSDQLGLGRPKALSGHDFGPRSAIVREPRLGRSVAGRRPRPPTPAHPEQPRSAPVSAPAVRAMSDRIQALRSGNHRQLLPRRSEPSGGRGRARAHERGRSSAGVRSGWPRCRPGRPPNALASVSKGTQSASRAPWDPPYGPFETGPRRY